MHIQNLTENSSVYTSNAWLCSCDSQEVRCKTLIDTGCDPHILHKLREIKKRSGRNPVDRIILTHNHYDHARLLGEIKKEYEPVIYAQSPYTTGVDKIIQGGDVIECGRYHFEIIAIPGHTTDSVCIYCPEEEILFSGDTPVVIWGTENTYEKSFVTGFELLAMKNIKTIYPGHGECMTDGIAGIIRQSLLNLSNSRIF